VLRDDPRVTFLIRRWANGDSILPAVHRLMELGFNDEAAATARLGLVDSECQDRPALEAALLEISSAPPGWVSALEEFARNPTDDGWSALMRFVPEEVFYQRLRNTVPILMRLGCDGDVLFRCASRFGFTPDLFDLAASGTVKPETIEERGRDSGARAAWLGLAAQAAFARGDRFATIRYLREACRDEENASLAWASAMEIRELADDTLNAELDKVGVPQQPAYDDEDDDDDEEPF
jgi:hypothetical protein